jgi:hypothetical protein
MAQCSDLMNLTDEFSTQVVAKDLGWQAQTDDSRALQSMRGVGAGITQVEVNVILAARPNLHDWMNRDVAPASMHNPSQRSGPRVPWGSVKRDADLAGLLFVAAGNALFIVRCRRTSHLTCSSRSQSRNYT